MFHNALRSVARSACQMQRARFMSTSPFPTLAAPKQLQPTFFQPQPLMFQPLPFAPQPMEIKFNTFRVPTFEGALTPLEFTSVLRKRRTKMNRHQLKKRRKRERFSTRKSTKD